MDRQFLEFWGNVLLATAKGQQQLEQLAPWLKGMGADSPEWAGLFKKIYGLENSLAGSKAWEQALQQFQSSLKEWMALFDMVPRSELTAAQKKNQELEQQLVDQQATIEQLQQLLNEKGIPSSKAVLDFSNLMQKQSKQFQKLMGNLGDVFKTDKDTSEED
jgi:hypothetical protein